MAQSGIIPPIGPHSTLPVFTGVFADIGDRQSIAASLSTFSAHVAVLRDILERAAAGSLVLLDEIGSGTDPAEGGALATAVLHALLATVEARARELDAREQELAARDQSLRGDAEKVDARAAELAAGEREVKARAQSLEREAREQARAYLLEARKKVEDALGRARAGVDEATAREGGRLVGQAIDATDEGAGSGERGAGWMSLEHLKRVRKGSPSTAL